MLQTTPETLNEEELVVLWTRLHEEMSNGILQGYGKGEGTACFANAQGLSRILLWH